MIKGQNTFVPTLFTLHSFHSWECNEVEVQSKLAITCMLYMSNYSNLEIRITSSFRRPQ